MANETKNTKLLVNFDTRKVVAVKHHAGSREYQHLIEKGYEQVGSCKPTGEIYIQPEYFNVEDKYPNIDTITT